MKHKKPEHIRIATRKSRLALWQAEWVQARLSALGVESALILVETQGDREQQPFHAMQGQGFFTKAVQQAVLEGRADIAVHSLKDLPAASEEGLTLAAVPCRADARDTLLVRRSSLCLEADGLPLHTQASVGTSSARRQAQLLHTRSDLQVRPLRGNVPTRIEKLLHGEYDAIVLAEAGLQRLEIEVDCVRIMMAPSRFVPAPGQGALAIECRSEEVQIQSWLEAHLQDQQAAQEVYLERAVMARLEGGCQLALGAHACLNTPEKPSGAELEGELFLFYAQQSHHLEGAFAGLMSEACNALGLEDGVQ
ncbi:MAG: hydroxymethylbilane synthase [Myxococcota bacterium]